MKKWIISAIISTGIVSLVILLAWFNPRILVLILLGVLVLLIIVGITMVIRDCWSDISSEQ